MNGSLMVLAAVIAGVLSLHAQQPTFSARREAVRVDVLVTDRGKPVRNLQAGDFELLDAGVPQQIDVVTFEQLPLSIVLALDSSASIGMDDLNHLRQGGRALLDGLKPEDQTALISFTDAVTLRERLTGSRDRIGRALDLLEPSRDPLGGTALIDACFTAMTLMDAESARSLLIAFTDGLDTSSWLPADRVLQAARRSNVVVYGVSTSGVPRRSFLRDLSEATGGGAIEIKSTADAGATFLEILDEFRQRYVIAFSPDNVPGTGWHPLTVRVKNRNLDVKARAGYTR